MSVIGRKRAGIGTTVASVRPHPAPTGVPVEFEQAFSSADMALLGRLAVLAASARPATPRWKRAMDFVIAVPALAVASPLILSSALVVLALDRHWPIYADERIGLGGRAFRCFKLKTMGADPAILANYLAVNPDESRRYQDTRKLHADPRITRVGRFLRRSSIDELPQLLNVIRGEMSVVGPRPIARREFESRGILALPLTRARPGLTGPWQVSGRSDLGPDERVALDNGYVERLSFLGDLGVLLRTPRAVLGARGAR
jgi:exopolysaccharide production protein ExoY